MRITVSSPVLPLRLGNIHSQCRASCVRQGPNLVSLLLLQVPGPRLLSVHRAARSSAHLRTPIHGISLHIGHLSATVTGQKWIFLQPELIRKSWKSMQAHGPECIGCLIFPPTNA